MTEEQLATAENVVPESEALEGQPVAADTTETVAETDEEKNQRELEERRQRSEKQARGIQKRLDELTADKYAERQRAEQLAEQNKRLLEMLQGRQDAPQAQSNEPRREQFQDYESFLEARAEWRAAQRAEKLVQDALSQLEQRQQQTVHQQQAVAARAQFEDRMEQFAKDKDDWSDVVENNVSVQIPDEAGALLHLMDDGPAVLYAIGKNPALAKQLWGKPVPLQAMVLGQISASLKSSPQVSKAPPPGKPVGSRGGTVDDGPQDSDPPDVWLKKRMAQLRK